MAKIDNVIKGERVVLRFGSLRSWLDTAAISGWSSRNRKNDSLLTTSSGCSLSMAANCGSKVPFKDGMNCAPSILEDVIVKDHMARPCLLLRFIQDNTSHLHDDAIMNGTAPGVSATKKVHFRAGSGIRFPSSSS